MERQYTPSKTVGEFMECPARQRLIIGPIGSGKTTGAIVEMVRRAHLQPQGPDGIRRYRAALVRNTKEQLRDTTMKSFFAMFPPGIAGQYRVQDAMFVMKTKSTEFEFLFRALDTPDDTRRLLSLELSAGFLEETREIDEEVFVALNSRIGRYPSVAQGGCPHPCLVMVTNPPVVGTWLWDLIENKRPRNLAVFRQPPALIPGTHEINPEAENLANLDTLPRVPGDYYRDSLDSATNEEWINVYLRNQYGSVQGGQAVYREEYDPSIHVSALPLEANERGTLYLGVDAGLTPAVAIGQISPSGQVQVLDEVIGKGVGAYQFIRKQVMPLLLEKYSRNSRIVILDPAARQRAQTDERTVKDMFEAAGFKAILAKTNNPIARIDSVKRLMTRRIDVGGKTTIPGLLISPSCHTLRSACSGGYFYAMSRKEVMSPSPVKNHFSHISDALQYLSLHTEDSLGLEGARRPTPAVRMANEGWRGWTI